MRRYVEGRLGGPAYLTWYCPGGWNVPSPLPSTTITPGGSVRPRRDCRHRATARSSRPSPLKSPTTMEPGNWNSPVGNCCGAWNVPSPLPQQDAHDILGRIFPMLPPPPPSTARSRRPSPLKSPATRVTGKSRSELSRGLEGCRHRCRAAPRCRRHPITARSSRPSPVKSPATINRWAGYCRATAAGSGMSPSPLPSSTDTIAGGTVAVVAGDGEVEPAVPVEVTGDQVEELAPTPGRLVRLEGAVAVAQDAPRRRLR